MIYLFATIGLCIYIYLHSISAGVCLNDKLYNNTYDYKTPLGAPLPILHITTMILIILSWSFTGRNLYSQLGPRSPTAWAEVSGPRPPWAEASMGRRLRIPTRKIWHILSQNLACVSFDFCVVPYGLTAHKISELSDCNCRFCPIPPIVKISNPLSL